MEPEKLNLYSNLSWTGIKPLKFNHNEKIHLRANNNLTDFQGGNLLADVGRRHFTPSYGESKDWQPILKVNITRPKEGNTQEFPPGEIKLDYYYFCKGKKLIQFEPTQKPPRAQRMHIQEQISGHLEDFNIGIKTFSDQQNYERQYNIEQMMTRKNRIGGFNEIRNNLPVRSLGDKQYRHPDYSKDYFKEGGLIPGANIQTRKVNINQLQAKEMEEKLRKVGEKLKKGTKWTDRLQMDARKFDQDAIDELDAWIEGTLKEANPNYKDPDLFFENLEKQEKLTQKKDIKKQTKK